jgi:hypothetical protein
VITSAVFICYGMAAVFASNQIMSQPRVLAAMRNVFATYFLGL